jgi:uncharacterized protein (DUF1697 family)
MTRYAAFLRGVNLGKRTVKSAELKAAFEAMGFADVKTLLASGNVLFDARASKTLQQKIETGLAMFFSCLSPRATKSASIWPWRWSCTAADMQTPPGGASGSRRAATLTPSP